MARGSSEGGSQLLVRLAGSLLSAIAGGTEAAADSKL